jgi:tetratricopeptide (TPR) repeat protein
VRPVLLCLFCILLITAAPAEDRLLGTPDQREQIGHEKFLQEHPGSAAAHSSYAEFLSERGNLRAAIAHWRTAQQLAPGNAAIANSLGGAYLRMGKAAASAAAFARAIDLERDNAAYHFNLANVEFMLRHDLATAWKMELPAVLRLALAEFREASGLAPNDVEYARAYAETFYGVPDADWSQAEAAWKHVLSLSPEADFAYLQLARVSLKRGDAEAARQFLNKVVNVRHDGLKRKLRAQADRL